MDVREKLVEIMADIDCNAEDCKDCEFCNDIDGCVRRQKEIIADRLIAHGVTVQEWISVKDEKKPKDRKNYFIAYVFGDSDMHFFGESKYHAYEGNGIVDRPHFSNEGVDGMRVTHWMEIPKLPEPPKGE